MSGRANKAAGKAAPQLELPGTKADPARALRIERLGPEARDGKIVGDLGRWFDAVARDLPWRRRRDPYAVWLSEIMLQQTRVETVIPYFERFLERFPEVSALAAAEIDEVLSLWSGLGYYRRARGLHAAAKAVVERHGGIFPGEMSDLRALPGVGAYTAGAIGSLAFGKRVPLVDGNVARVFARLDGIDTPIAGSAAVKTLWERAAELVPADRPGRFNEALMELGATTCTPRDPRCGACPLEAVCVARATGRVGELPVVETKRKVPVVAMVAVVLARKGEVLLVRRAEGGLFGGLWEPPMVEAGTLTEAREALTAVGVGAALALTELGQLKHVLTHRELRVRVASGAVGARAALPSTLAPPYEKARWIDPADTTVGVSTLARKILALATK